MHLRRLREDLQGIDIEKIGDSLWSSLHTASPAVWVCYARIQQGLRRHGMDIDAQKRQMTVAVLAEGGEEVCSQFLGHLGTICNLSESPMVRLSSILTQFSYSASENASSVIARMVVAVAELQQGDTRDSAVTSDGTARKRMKAVPFTPPEDLAIASWRDMNPETQ